MVGSTRIPIGAFTFAFYWCDRNYNVYHWLDPEGKTLGFYFNAANRTVIDSTGVEWDDLELDYWLDADGHAAFLDGIPNLWVAFAHQNPVGFTQTERGK